MHFQPLNMGGKRPLLLDSSSSALGGGAEVVKYHISEFLPSCRCRFLFFIAFHLFSLLLSCFSNRFNFTIHGILHRTSFFHIERAC